MTEAKYSIKITPKAFEDLDEIYSYISDELYNKSAANNLLEKIETSIMRLKEFPFSCNFVTDEILKDKGYRKLIVENYIAFYLVKEEKSKLLSCVFCMEDKNTKILFSIVGSCSSKSICLCSFIDSN